MKALLKSLILLNLVLATALALILVAGHKQAAEPATQVVMKTGRLPDEMPAVPPQTTAGSEPKPFCWNQLESPDFHVYVKNLRSIGCPEPTVRAIISADVDAIYQNRSEGLEQRLSELANSSWAARLAAYTTEQSLKAELQELPEEEASEIEDYLGLPSVAAQVAADTTSAAQASQSDNESPDPVSMPLIFQAVDPAALNLSSDQMDVINNLRLNFIKAIGGLNQDPSDPAYMERWQKAQPEADDMLRGMLGISVFENLQMASNKNAP